MTSQEQTQIQQIKCQTAKRYGLDETQADEVFDIALGDYLLIKYPCDANRPTPDDLVYDFVVLRWLSALVAMLMPKGAVPK